MLLIMPRFGSYSACEGASCADMTCGNAMQLVVVSQLAPSAAPVARGRQLLVCWRILASCKDFVSCDDFLTASENPTEKDRDGYG
jgi:hypothetical protein